MPRQLLLLLLLLQVFGQCCAQRRPVICIEDSEVYKAVQASELAGKLQLRHFPLAGRLENVSSVGQVHLSLKTSKCEAVLSDYYISLGISTKSESADKAISTKSGCANNSIPYFLIRKKVTEYPPSVDNFFEIEIDNFHLSAALRDLSLFHRRTHFIIVSDGTAGSSQFLIHLKDKVFNLHTVSNLTSSDALFDLFYRNSGSSGLAWILLFSQKSLGLMERLLTQAARAGALTSSHLFFIPSLLPIESQLARFYRSDAQFYSFRLAGLHADSSDKLLMPFVIDCLSHYLHAFTSGGRGCVTVQDLTQAVVEKSMRTGVYGYSSNKGTKARSHVQLVVLRSNSSAPTSGMFADAGTWIENDTAQPFQPKFTSYTGISRSQIRFAALEVEPYLYKYRGADGKVVTTGLGMELVQLLSSALGFNYTLVSVRDGEYGVRGSDGNWSGLMRLLQSQEADVTLNFMTPSAERLEVADRSIDFVQDGIQMMKRKVVHTQDFFHVFHPFSLFVWVSILLAIVVLSFTLYFSDIISPNMVDKDDPTNGKKMFSPFESFFLVFSSFLMSKVRTEPINLSSRLFTLLLYFATLMYVTSYLSNLVSIFVKPNDSFTITVLEELQDTSDYKWGFLEGSAVAVAVNQTWPRLFQRAEREWPKEMWYSNFNAAIQKLLNDPNFVLIASADSLSFVKSWDCKLRLVNSVEQNHYLTLLFRKGFPFKDELNRQLQVIKNDQLSNVRAKYFELNRCYAGKIDIENKVQLGFDYLGGLFLLLGIGCGLAFLQLLLHWLWTSSRLCGKAAGLRSAPLKLGRTYSAEVLEQRHDGVWIRVSDQQELHFLHKQCWHTNSYAPDSTKISNLPTGSRIRVKYYGKDGVSKNKMFLLSAEGLQENFELDDSSISEASV